ncbi:hypothetical protein H6F96_15640 [Microcoleus sp. FACHB-53]|nr:hypothetical protein [Microcoleus sp. FACHB-53]MBD2126380.1 hypothetical protein [Microcoleus sp. FACHB-1]
MFAQLWSLSLWLGRAGRRLHLHPARSLLCGCQLKAIATLKHTKTRSHSN